YSNINFTNNSQLIFDNPATVYVTGSVNAGQQTIIKPASSVPKDLMIRMTGGATSVFGGSNANNIVITAQIYAPSTDMVCRNNADFYGSVLFRSISVQNNLNAYYDSDSGSVLKDFLGYGDAVTTVQ